MIPKYIQLKDRLSEEISQKKYPLYSKLPTENELAEEYGLSRSTVRQALALLKEDGIISKHWGSGNTVINTYSSSKKDTVALIVPGIPNPEFSDMIKELQSSLYKEDIFLEVLQTGGSQFRERQILDQVSKDVYAGYIIQPSSLGLPSMNTDMYQKLLRRQIPLLFIFSCPVDFPGTSTLYLDDHECGYMSARHLINKGHKSIGAVFRCNNSVSSGRFSGFIDAIRDSNLPLQEEYIYWIGPDQSLLDLDLFMEKAKGHVTGIVCNDRDITDTIYGLCQNNSLAVPDDLSLLCCEYITEDPQSPMSFSCTALTKSLGREIFNDFLSIKKDGSIKNTAIGYKLIQRESS